jgi:UDP-glucose 4-epimerase
MKVMVTGGAGFIGSHITDAYIKAGHEVLIVDNLSTGKPENVNPQAKLETMDLNDGKLISLIAAYKPDLINHHAAQIDVRKSVSDPRFDAQTNILGFLNLMQGAMQLDKKPKLVFASSGGAIYGEATEVPTPETYWPAPLSPYGIAKLTTEYYLQYYYLVHHIPYIALRYANVYGPRQNAHGEAGVVAIFMQRIKDAKDFVINGQGLQTRDFVYVGDVVSANMAASTSKIESGYFNIGTQKQTTINELIQLMQTIIKHDQEIPHGPAKAGEQMTSCLNINKAKQTFNWQPQMDLNKGLVETAKFFGFNP